MNFGASYHLTCSSEHFVSYIGHKKIRIADDSLVPNAGKVLISPHVGLLT